MYSSQRRTLQTHTTSPPLSIPFIFCFLWTLLTTYQLILINAVVLHIASSAHHMAQHWWESSSLSLRFSRSTKQSGKAQQMTLHTACKRIIASSGCPSSKGGHRTEQQYSHHVRTYVIIEWTSSLNESRIEHSSNTSYIKYFWSDLLNDVATSNDDEQNTTVQNGGICLRMSRHPIDMVGCNNVG